MPYKKKVIYTAIFTVDCDGKKREIFKQERKESRSGQCLKIISTYGEKEGQYYEDVEYGCVSQGDEVINIEEHDLKDYVSYTF